MLGFQELQAEYNQDFLLAVSPIAYNYKNARDKDRPFERNTEQSSRVVCLGKRLDAWFCFTRVIGVDAGCRRFVFCTGFKRRYLDASG